jgi:hypothetical protein
MNQPTGTRFLLVTEFHKNLFETGFDILDQYLIPIFWYPYKMILTPIYRVGRFPIPFHTATSPSIPRLLYHKHRLTNIVGSLKEWGLRPHTPPLTMSVD